MTRQDSTPDEDLSERLTRNWNELLQELRVVMPGVQIITGFLLTVPFSEGFDDLDGFQRTTLLVVLSGAVATTVLVVAPVSFHRALFHQRQRDWLVEAAHWCARVGLTLLGVVLAGVVLLVFDVVAGRGLSITAGSVAAALFVALWYVVPRLARERGA